MTRKRCGSPVWTLARLPLRRVAYTSLHRAVCILRMFKTQPRGVHRLYRTNPGGGRGSPQELFAVGYFAFQIRAYFPT